MGCEIDANGRLIRDGAARGQTTSAHRIARGATRLSLTALLLASTSGAAMAACGTVGATTTCDTAPPNPWTTTVGGGSNDNNRIVNVLTGATISTSGQNGVSVGQFSSVTIDGAVEAKGNTAAAYGVAINGNSAITVNSGGRVEFIGSDTTTAASAAVYFNIRPTVTATSTLINYGSISSTSIGAKSEPAIYVLGRAESIASIDNFGSISIGGVATSGDKLLDANDQGPRVFYTNRTGATTFGSLLLKNRDDRVTLETGSTYTGIIDGGGGRNEFILQGAGAQTLDTSVTNFSTLTKQGNGTWTLGSTLPTILSGTGPTSTSVEAGTLVVTGDNRSYTGTTSVSSGAVLEGAALAIPLLVTDNGTVRFSDAGTGTYGGSLSGSGGVEKTGAGTTTLTGSNNYSGTTVVTGGKLQVGGASAVPTNTAVTVGAAGTFDVNGFNQTIGSLAGDGNTTLGGGSITTGGDNTSTNYFGVISGDGSLTKTGSGVFTLSGANSYTGATNITGGTLQTGAINTLPGQSAVSVAGGATFDLNGFNQAIGSLAGAGNTRLGAGTLTTGGNNASTAYSGVISGSGALTKTGSGVFTLSGANSYTGATNINGGTLQVGGANAVPTNTAVTVGAAGTFDVNGYNQTIGSLAGGGNTTLGGGSLTTGGNNTSTTYSGVISGSGSLTKTGSGVFTLSGANSYTGATNITGGTLQAAAINTLPGLTPVTVAPGAVFDLAGFDQTIGSLAGAGNTRLGAGTLTTGGNNASTLYSGVIDGAGGVTKVGTGTFELSNANSYTGPTQIAAGTLLLTGSITSPTTVAAGATLQGNGTIFGDVANSGTIRPGLPNAIGALTVAGSYVGANGLLVSRIGAPNTAPVADVLVISGPNALGSGATRISVVDQGGLGAATSGDGIRLVEAANGARTTAGAFALSGRVSVGAYDYHLFRGGYSAGSGESWYLRTLRPVEPGEPASPGVVEKPAYRAETAAYPALPALQRLYTYALVDTLDQRRGESLAPDLAGKTLGAWARLVGYGGASHVSTTQDTGGPSLTYRTGFLQTGLDLLVKEWGGARSVNGAFFATGLGSADTRNAASRATGVAGLTGYTAGVYSTNYAANGMYVDLIGQATRFVDATARAYDGVSMITNGKSVSGSVEGGWRLPLGHGFYATPQAQAVVDAFQFATAADAFGRMAFPSQTGLRGRLGVLVGATTALAGVDNAVDAWVRANVWNVFRGPGQTIFSHRYGANGVAFNGDLGRTWFAVDAGLSGAVGNRVKVFANLGYETGTDISRYAVTGRIGAQAAW